MGRTHNKKRNVGLMYELLLRSISSALVEDRKKDAQVALDIISSRFAKDTELYREFRLFNALAKSTVSDTSIAAAILSEAKNAARRFNRDALEKEKADLIREINYNVKDDSFYHRKVSNYKIYATIQTLLNDWRENDKSDLSRLIQYEGKIVEWLLHEKEVDIISEDPIPEVDNLIVKILTEKFNNKYNSILSKEQQKIIKTYVFSRESDNCESICNHLTSLKEETVDQLVKFKNTCKNSILLEKVDLINKRLSDLSCEKVDDETIKRFLTVSQLKQEILKYKEV